ncbi:DUF7662 domain-containing protein [Brevundimonas sp.]|jgi:hypothetical protein|uniref:DUF7662 domain-containing protein n=1 Tax=Brevundimonas sp. TaxID=1871086 RepID=UPI002FD9C4BB
MAKYTPLAAFLRRQTGAEVDLSFRDIERIVGGILPKAASLEDWWRANPAREQMPQHLAFADAGFVADPRTRAETVRFIRVAGVGVTGSAARLSATKAEG